MKVVFSCKDLQLYDVIVEQFKKAKEADTESGWDFAELQLSENSATYLTCCSNRWFVERKNGVVYFGYEGTRAGAIRLTPFSQLYWDSIAEFGAILSYVKEWQEYSVEREDGYVFKYMRVPKVVKEFALGLEEYETTTPSDWALTWYDQVEKVGEDQAVIMRNGRPIKVVP
jgi:hypothetical protein